MDYRCYSCLAKAYTKLLEEHNLTADERERHTKAFLSFMASAENGLIAPEVARKNQHQIKELLGIEDPYKDIKIRSNQYLLDKYPYFRDLIKNSKDPFDTALRLAIAGNIIDYAANPDFDLEGTIDKVLKEDFAINHSAELKKKLKTANTVLYLGDNAGEIVMDKLFLEHLELPNVYYAVRNAPVINDVTLEDARQTGIDKHATVISNGYDAPSTILSRVSKEFMEIYTKADVVISKGQGNLEETIKREKPKTILSAYGEMQYDS